MISWKAFSREALFDRQWYLRSERIVVYQVTVLISMVAQAIGTYCMFKYKFLAQNIHNFSMHTAHVDEVDIRATTILSMIFPALIGLNFNAAYFCLVFYPGRKFPRFNTIITWSTAIVTIGMAATTLASTVVVATGSALISGVDSSTAQQLTDLYFRPPLKYKTWGQNIAWIVMMWITLALNFASVMLMWMASSYDSKNGSNLVRSLTESKPNASGPVAVPASGEDKVSEIEEKTIPVVA